MSAKRSHGHPAVIPAVQMAKVVHPALTDVSGGVQIQIKVVPGASRGRVMGWLGDRLKVVVCAPPEGGKANAALCALLAQEMGVSSSSVTVVAGFSSPRKIVRMAGITAMAVLEKIGKSPGSSSGLD